MFLFCQMIVYFIDITREEQFKATAAVSGPVSLHYKPVVTFTLGMY